jgi:hypothetical protein
MAATDSLFSSVSGARTIGHYFTVVSFLPSTVFVAYVIVLARSGAWSGHAVNFAAAVSDLSLEDAAVFGVASMLVALTLHPLQSVLVQIYEGYWGRSTLATRAAMLATLRQRQRSDKLESTALEHDLAVQIARDTDGDHPADSPEALASQVSDQIAGAESWRLFGEYPERLSSTMPTRLGNVLRRYELLAGAMFGMDAITYVPRVIQLADARDVAYVRNQRIQLELALRSATLGLVATALTLCFMWRHGAWLLLALGPYALAYATYRGAVTIAHEYGTSLAILLELNRFALYQRLHLPLPEDLEHERKLNDRLAKILRLDNQEIEQRRLGAHLDYVHPDPAGEPTSAQADSDGGRRSS